MRAVPGAAFHALVPDAVEGQFHGDASRQKKLFRRGFKPPEVCRRGSFSTASTLYGNTGDG
jgi:hypothetical protein